MTQPPRKGSDPAQTDMPLPLSIAEVAEVLGIPVPTVRSWERRYGILAPRRTPGGHRRYSDEDVERIRVLRDEILRGHRPREVARRLRAAEQTQDQPRRDALVSAALDLDEAALRRILDDAAIAVGVEETLDEVALPALRRIGDHWQSGGCGTQHEHLATHEIRGWIARMAALAPPPFRDGTILLATAAEDTHSVALEGSGLLLARRGWACIILGPRTPTAAVIDTIGQRPPAAVVISSQWTRARRSTVEELRTIDRTYDGALFYAGAAFAAPVHRKQIPGIYLEGPLTDAMRALESHLLDGKTRTSFRRRSARQATGLSRSR